MTRSTLIAACVLLVVGSGARGQFTPGHVFVADVDSKACANPGFPGGDRIWEFDPATGEVTLFAELTAEQCGLFFGLAFTPGFTRLRASLSRGQILEFDSEANLSVVLDDADGISFPNALAYDADGNLYVLIDGGEIIGGGKILRFANGAAPGTVFADEQDGLFNHGAMAFAADGDLYVADSLGNRVLRITPEGNGTVFEQFGLDPHGPRAVTAVKGGHVYVGMETGEIFRYDPGDPGSKELLVTLAAGSAPFAMAMSLDDSRIYVTTFSIELLAVDPFNGVVTTVLPLINDGLSFTTAIAVAPAPAVPPIPAASQWGLVVMTILLLTGATIVIGGMHRRCCGTRSVETPYS